jgi:hypothetical protein
MTYPVSGEVGEVGEVASCHGEAIQGRDSREWEIEGITQSRIWLASVEWDHYTSIKNYTKSLLPHPHRIFGGFCGLGILYKSKLDKSCMPSCDRNTFLPNSSTIIER